MRPSHICEWEEYLPIRYSQSLHCSPIILHGGLLFSGLTLPLIYASQVCTPCTWVPSYMPLLHSCRSETRPSCWRSPGVSCSSWLLLSGRCPLTKVIFIHKERFACLSVCLFLSRSLRHDKFLWDFLYLHRPRMKTKLLARPQLMVFLHEINNEWKNTLHNNSCMYESKIVAHFPPLSPSVG